MPMFTKYTTGSVYHILPVGGELRSDGKLTPGGYIDAPLCGAHPGDVADEMNGRVADITTLKVCKACLKKSAQLNNSD